MFYEPDKGHGLPHDPFKAIVAPRPIGWISTRSATGVANLAPYSFFNAVSSRPPLVMFSSDGEKNSLRNIRQSGEFACNFVTYDLFGAMNASSADVPGDVSEFGFANLQEGQCQAIAAPCVAAAAAVLECKLTEITSPKALNGSISRSVLVFGQVIGVRIDPAMLNDGLFDVTARGGVVSRLGYMDYAVTREVFSARRPDWQPAKF